ncbi:hypothetical protein [Prescottella sp. R16]|uniref:hypothetical protein n=1 Tax=Prescottella sp. R16 TaxID=3064529 RepID=UPI00272E17D3|nr:hypothetical protein [Prescottella sp. R16]
MQRERCRGSFAALFTATVAGLATMAASSPATAATTTVFPIPVRFVAGCSFDIMECWGLPPLTTVVPAATPGTDGTVTFTADHAARVSAHTLYCVAVRIHWRNLTTGDADTTTLEPVDVDFTQPYPANPWCRYTPATVDTGGGHVVATADVVTFGAPPAKYQNVVHPGVGVFDVAGSGH